MEWMGLSAYWWVAIVGMCVDALAILVVGSRMNRLDLDESEEQGAWSEG